MSMNLDDVVAVKEAFDELGQHWPELSICCCGAGVARRFTLGPKEGHNRAKLLFRELAPHAVRHLGVGGNGTAEELLLKFVVEEMPDLREPDPTGSDVMRNALRRSFGEPVAVIRDAATAVATALVSRCDLRGHPVQLRQSVGFLKSPVEGGCMPEVRKGCWPKWRLVEVVKCSESTVASIQSAAGVSKRKPGGQSPDDLYSIRELRLMIAAAESGNFRSGGDIGKAWRELLSE